MKEIKNLINNQNFLVDEPEKGEPETPCMYVYKEKIQSDGCFDNLKLRIVVRGDLQKNDLIGDTWSPASSIRTLKKFLSDSVKNKARVHQLDFIGELLQEKFKYRVFVKLDSRYADYFLSIKVLLKET